MRRGCILGIHSSGSRGVGTRTLSGALRLGRHFWLGLLALSGVCLQEFGFVGIAGTDAPPSARTIAGGQERARVKLARHLFCKVLSLQRLKNIGNPLKVSVLV